ncbi:hypothetical protein DDZ13_13895 [Coraliomargarita sinensis]|uniref:Uncharacterized protein n=1 Tax=Coraliomargarita sinensis TaxID=2174842 RepID=A0A317ZI18_9BACT|nr:hypothetical protein [Coraliomargarita sinensis]PXA03011.1 hypothetical protein DDZ13_13895 [Coraliomargarita sinensis]
MAPSPQHSASTPSSRISGCVVGRIRKLKGFQKHHTVPDSVNDATRSFVRRAGQEDVKTLADDLYRDIRSTFGYKRREFDYTCEDGEAWIKTPDFDAQIRIDQDESEAKYYQLTTELLKLHNEAIAMDTGLHACFNAHCDYLVVNFPAPIQVEDKIDAIEANDDLTDCLSYEPDASAFELKLRDLDLQIEVDAWSVRFSLLTLRNLGKLIDHSQRAFEILTDYNFDLRLSAPST